MIPLNFQTSFLWAKIIHRLSMFSTVFLMMLMGITGFMLKWKLFLPAIFLDYLNLRELHGRIGLITSGAFGVMAVTGFWMYLYPQLPKSNNQPQHQSTQASNTEILPKNPGV